MSKKLQARRVPLHSLPFFGGIFRQFGVAQYAFNQRAPELTDALQRLRRQARTWVLVLWAVASGIGTMSSNHFAGELGLTSSDVNFDPQTYALMAITLASFLAILAVSFVLPLIATVRLRSWIDGWSLRVTLTALVALIALSMLVTLPLTRAGGPITTLLVAASLQSAILGIGVAAFPVILSASPPGYMTILRVFATIIAAGFTMIVVTDLVEEGGHLAVYTRSLASESPPIEAPSGLLSWFVLPERGLAEFEGETPLCVVRLHDKLFLTVGAHDGAPPKIRAHATTFRTEMCE